MADESQGDLNEIADRLALILSGVRAASVVRDSDAVRMGASELLAEIEPLHRQGRESGKPELLWYSHLPDSGAGLWLVESSAKSMLDHLNSATPDWDGIGAASSFAETGVQRFQDAISGKVIGAEELQAALAETMAHIEERLQATDLPTERRESMTKMLHYLREPDEK